MQVNASSMGAHTSWLNNNANNVANVNTKEYNSTQTTLHEKGLNSVEATSSKSKNGTNLAKELTDQIPIEKGFDAQAKAIKVQEETMGGLLNILA